MGLASILEPKFLSPYDRILYYQLKGDEQAVKQQLRRFFRQYGLRFSWSGGSYAQVIQRLEEPTPDIDEAAVKHLIKEYKRLLIAFPQDQCEIVSLAITLCGIFSEPDPRKQLDAWQEHRGECLRFLRAHHEEVLQILSRKTLKLAEQEMMADRAERHKLTTSYLLSENLSGFFILMQLPVAALEQGDKVAAQGANNLAFGFGVVSLIIFMVLLNSLFRIREEKKEGVLKEHLERCFR